jgi:uncharacterized protein DUF2795
MQEMQASENASQFVEGLDYPIGKAEILSAARATNVGPTIQGSLDKIADREYADAEDLTKELTRAS